MPRKSRCSASGYRERDGSIVIHKRLNLAIRQAQYSGESRPTITLHGDDPADLDYAMYDVGEDEGDDRLEHYSDALKVPVIERRNEEL